MTSASFLRPPCNLSQRAFGFIALSIALIVAFLYTSSAQVEGGLYSIRQDELQQKLISFASAEFKGRGNGMPEMNLAAQYIADGFRRNGVQPAGDDGTYFQNFEMFRSELGRGNRFQVEGRQPSVSLALGRDYTPHYLSPTGTIKGKLVFVGFGVSAPHLNFDEFAGVDLKGKVAVAIDGNPNVDDPSSAFNKVHVSDFFSVGSKARSAHDAGATGLIIIQNPRMADNLRIGQHADMFQRTYPLRFSPMGSLSDPDNPPIPVVMVSEAAGRILVNGLPELHREIDRTGRPRSRELLDSVDILVNVIRQPFTTKNVLGVIPGSDPTLQAEVIVVGAHYDHDGEYNGRIWFGADDNASGTVALIELAEAFASGRDLPKRSILLCAWAGEEKGLLGSRYYSAHPVRPLSSTIAMFQLDMIGRDEEHRENARLGLARESAAENSNAVNLIGSMFSPDLKRLIETSNVYSKLTLKFRYDDTPENLIRRSDQWPFLRKGVPSMFFHTGEHPDYHTPGDTPDKINYPKFERITRLVYSTLLTVGNTATRPRFVTR